MSVILSRGRSGAVHGCPVQGRGSVKVGAMKGGAVKGCSEKGCCERGCYGGASMKRGAIVRLQ